MGFDFVKMFRIILKLQGMYPHWDYWDHCVYIIRAMKKKETTKARSRHVTHVVNKKGD